MMFRALGLTLFLLAVACYPPAALAVSGAPTQWICGDEIVLQRALREHPELVSKLIAPSGAARREAAEGLAASTGPVAIPVVVHLVYSAWGAPASPQKLNTTLCMGCPTRIEAQIDALNRDFQNTPAIPGAANTEISFCLVEVVPHLDATLTQNHCTLPGAKLLVALDAPSGAPLHPTDSYLNVWIVESIDDGIGGYWAGGFNTSDPDIDCIVIRADFIGNEIGAPYLLPGVDEGKVLTHEVGHFLSLFHPWEFTASNCSGSGDYVADTQTQNVPRTGCPVGPVYSCSATIPDPTDNFMEWTNDACRNKFTPGQRDRMRDYVDLNHAKLVDSNNPAFGGSLCLYLAKPDIRVVSSTPCTPPIVDGQGTELCPGGKVVYQTTPPAAGSVTYVWDFGSGVITGGNSAGPGPIEVTYPSAGKYSVGLTVTTTAPVTSGSVTRKDLVYVSNCSPIASPQGNWYLGQNAALNFNSGVPVPVTTSQALNNEAYCTQSDAAGNLIFYATAEDLWDVAGNHIGTLGGANSITQGVMCLPDPDATQPNRYYLFLIGAGGTADFLCYRTLTVSGSPGSYQVAASALSPNIALPGPVDMNITEEMTAVPMCGQTGYWIIVHGFGRFFKPGDTEHRTFYVVPLTAAGIGTVIPQSILPAAGLRATTAGYLKASPDGRWLALSGNFKDDPGARSALYSFDPVSGAITWKTNLSHGNYGCSFSPLSKLLYMGESPSSFPPNSSDPIQKGTVYQYDLADPAPDVSGRLVYSNNVGVAALQLGPDGKIYVARPRYAKPDRGQDPLSAFLDVINFPDNRNVPGVAPNACGYNPAGQSLGCRMAMAGLPNMVDARRPACDLSPQFLATALNCHTFQFAASACGNQTFSWDFGDGSPHGTGQSPQHSYASDGVYTVSLTVTCDSASSGSSQTLRVGIGNLTIVGPTHACDPPSSYSVILDPAHWPGSTGSGLKYNWVATGGVGTSSTAAVVVAWDPLVGGTLVVTVTDPVTGCTASQTLLVGPCCVDPPLGMTSWWPFDETAGPKSGEIIAGRAGTWFGSPTPVVQGAVAGAIAFDGVNDYVRVPHATELNMGTLEFAIDAWVKTGSTATYNPILEKSDNSAGYTFYLNAGRPALRCRSAAGTIDGISSIQNFVNPLVNDRQWHHIAVSVRRVASAVSSTVGSSRVDLQACKLEYSIVSPK